VRRFTGTQLGASHDQSFANATFEMQSKDEDSHRVIFESYQWKVNSMVSETAQSISIQVLSVENDLLTPTFKLKRQKARINMKQRLRSYMLDCHLLSKF
jgi:hypothetical protein